MPKRQWRSFGNISPHRNFENKVYEGTRESLEALVKSGKKLYVASSKPEVFVRKILEHFELDSYFEFMGGADFEEIRVKKADVIRYVLDTCQIRDISKTVMIGDRKHDILVQKSLEWNLWVHCMDTGAGRTY